MDACLQTSSKQILRQARHRACCVKENGVNEEGGDGGGGGALIAAGRSMIQRKPRTCYRTGGLFKRP